MTDKNAFGKIALTDDKGVTKTIIKEASSPSLKTPSNNMEARVHYVGTLLDGTKFDSSRDRDDPFVFTLGQGEVIKAWDIGVQSMKVGEKCELICTAPYAYGEAGSGDKIPPNATLKFEIELLDVDFPPVTTDKTVRKEKLKEGLNLDKPNFGAKCRVRIGLQLKGSSEAFIPETEKEVVLNEKLVPAGLIKALKSMAQGEIARFYISPGKYHIPEDLLPEGVQTSSELVYKVEMISFVKKKEIYEMSETEKLAEGIKAKAKGNYLFKKSDFENAEKSYEYAVSCLEDFPGVSDDFGPSDPLLPKETEKKSEDKEKDSAKEEARALMVACLNNLSLLKSKKKDWQAVVSNSEKVLRIEETNVKARYKRAAAYGEMGDYEKSLSDLAVLRGQETTEKESVIFDRKSDEIKRKRANDKKSIDLMYRQMFDGIGRK